MSFLCIKISNNAGDLAKSCLAPTWVPHKQKPPRSFLGWAGYVISVVRNQAVMGMSKMPNSKKRNSS